MQSALAARVGPLNQALARFDLRTNKPNREHVQDEVEHALMQELNELQGCMGKLQVLVLSFKIIVLVNLESVVVYSKALDKHVNLQSWWADIYNKVA